VSIVLLGRTYPDQFDEICPENGTVIGADSTNVCVEVVDWPEVLLAVKVNVHS
jgi:hypothetical protein